MTHTYHGTKGIRVATQIAELIQPPQTYDIGYEPFGLSPTAPKVEGFNFSPVHTKHRLSEEILKS